MEEFGERPRCRQQAVGCFQNALTESGTAVPAAEPSRSLRDCKLGGGQALKCQAS
jgi:hypothetical protein